MNFKNMDRNYREHESVRSVIDFLTAIKKIRDAFTIPSPRGDDLTLWFRGQHNFKWGLTPKFYRPEFLKAAEADTRELFQSRGIQLIHGRQPSNEWEWYFVMQHHGAPTRLLDWTENPLIALYFAVKNHRKDEDAAIWIVDPYWLNEQNPNLKKSGVYGPLSPSWREADGYLIDLETVFSGKNISRKYPAAIEAPHVDVRLHAQASKFVVFGKTRDMSTAFSIKPKAFGLGKIRIQKEHVGKIEEELSYLGIHAAWVFPDLSGLGEFVCDSWKNRS